jgi:hypothetical protein
MHAIHVAVAAVLGASLVCLHTSILLLRMHSDSAGDDGLADTTSNVEGFGTSPYAPTAEHQRMLQTSAAGITIANSNSNLQWIGRVVTGKSDTRVFDWGGCAVRMRITGTTKLGLVVKVRGRVWVVREGRRGVW